MAARRTRAAARRAALVPFLSELSDDELEAIGYVLADPLAPRLAVALSSCSRGLRRALAVPLKELKERRQQAEELCAYLNANVDDPYEPPWSCDRLCDAKDLALQDIGLTAAHMETLGMLMATNRFSQLEDLFLGRNSIGDLGVQSLVGGLGRLALPSLSTLDFDSTNLGHAGAAALAAALSRGAMPSLFELVLTRNQIGDQGLIALAAPLRKHSALSRLFLDNNEIGDEGLSALVAPGEGVLPKLYLLRFDHDPITDAGCAKLIDALDNGVMPRLRLLPLHGVSAGDEAKEV